MLRKPAISEAIEAELQAAGVSEHSVRAWLASAMFGVDMADFQDILDGTVDLKRARSAGVPTKYITECTEHRTGSGESVAVTRRLKLVSPEMIIDRLIRVLGMITEKRQVTTSAVEEEDLSKMGDDDLYRLARASGVNTGQAGSEGSVGNSAA